MMDRRLVIVGLGALLLAACPKNVPQDRATGDDGRQKGAVPLRLENNGGRAGGIVTYPGGDRVDWKVIDLPKDAVGTMRLKLRWTPPRPGLDLSFEVYDEYGNVLATAKPNKRARSRKTTKAVTIENAKGKLFVQIYASSRGDAGKYALLADFDQAVVLDGADWPAQIADPPRLPAVPENPFICTQQNFSKTQKGCDTFCPSPHDPTWIGCANTCPTPVDPENKICQDTAPCPTPKDARFKSCKFDACDRRNLDASNPNCAGVTALLPDQFGEITDIQPTDLGSRIAINLGLADKIADGWRGVLLDGNGVKIKGSEFVVKRVGKNASVGDLKLDPSKVPASATVKLSQE